MVEDLFPAKLEEQRDACEALGSNLYAQMLGEAVREYRARGPVFYFLTKIPERATMSTPALRLLGAAHFLALAGKAQQLALHLPSCNGDGNAVAAWRETSALLVHQHDAMAELFAETPQTNEAARALVILAGYCAVVQTTNLPLRVLEIGASAGFVARADAYRYEGDGWAWGLPASPLVMRHRTVRGAPRLCTVGVDERMGCDVNPLDATSERDQMRLLSYIWPDQSERFARAKAAFAVAARVPMRIDKSDLFAWLSFVAKPVAGKATIVMHTVVSDHFDAETRMRLAGMMQQIGSIATVESPFAWLRMEMGAYGRHETRLNVWPHSDECLIATSDAHGQGIEWE